jgi:hypothetical protein
MMEAAMARGKAAVSIVLSVAEREELESLVAPSFDRTGDCFSSADDIDGG